LDNENSEKYMLTTEKTWHFITEHTCELRTCLTNQQTNQTTNLLHEAKSFLKSNQFHGPSLDFSLFMELEA
jgi:hypothetical protein